MRPLVCSALVLLLCAPLAAQRIGVTEMAPASLDELARNDVTRPYAPHEERPRPAPPATSAPAGAIVASFVRFANGAVAAPPVTRGFRAVSDPLPGSTTDSSPADASGAVGPHHVVGAFNNSLTVHGRDGHQLSLLDIYKFWHDPAFPDTQLYDPRVKYDAGNDRWVLAMLTDTNLLRGVLLVAVSATGDPTGTWRRFRVPVSDNPALTDDFTRLAMTADQIVITANQYDGRYGIGLDVFTIPKSAAYAATSTLTVTKTQLAAFELTPVDAADATVRLLAQGETYISLLRLENGKLTAISDYAPPVPFAFGQTICQQLGAPSPVDCGDTILHYAFLRNGTLWVVQSARSSSRGAIVVWKIAGSAAAGYLLADPNLDYAYPSLAVNRAGTALVGYSTLDRSIYPSAAYRIIDAAGNVSDPMTVKDGEGPPSYGRWGDFSTTLVDPVDDLSFWTLQSYGTPPLKTLPFFTWATWWSYVQVQPPPRTRAVRH